MTVLRRLYFFLSLITVVQSQDTQCNVGFYLLSATCTPCEQGFYQATAGYTGSTCTSCPSNTYTTTTGSTAVTQCTVCKLGYGPIANSGSLTASCNTCLAGTYKSAIDASTCTACPSNSYTTTTGSTAASQCTSCVAGYGTNTGGANPSCSICSAGSYSANGAATCTTCPSGATTTGQGSTSSGDCVCSAGYTGNGVTCTACAQGNYKSTTGSATCTDCPSNTYTSSTGSTAVTQCTVCKIGYGPITDPGSLTATCNACLAGTYKSTIDASACTLCPATTYTTGTGSQSVSSCTVCAAGYGTIGNSGSLTASCTICAIGSYSANGASTCSTCPTGYTTLSTGNTLISECLSCSAGYSGTSSYSGSALTGCTICGLGKYSAGGQGVTCQDCPSGATTTGQASTSSSACVCSTGYTGDGVTCTACDAGSYKSVTGSATCSTCVAGSYSTNAGASICSQCPPGKWGSLTGQVSEALGCPNSVTCGAGKRAILGAISASTACIDCEAGTFQTSTSHILTTCSICPIGSYSANGASTCSSCTTGYTTNATGKTDILQCLSCSAGYSGTSSYVNSALTGCTICGQGTYSGGGQGITCQTCPKGTFGSSQGFVSVAQCQPSPILHSGSVDTSFYLSGSTNEGVSAFSTLVNNSGGISFTSTSSFPYVALVLSKNSYLSTSSLLSTLPSGSSSFTVSSWVKCNASLLSDTSPSSVVLSWGEIGVLSTSENLKAVSLAVTSKERVKLVSAVSTFAGNGTAGFADGVGTSATFYSPRGIALDTSGNVYVADTLNTIIRKITSSRVVSTLAGGVGQLGHADGTGTNSNFYNPSGIAIDSNGNIYVADLNNHRIRKITPSGHVTTLAGNGSAGYNDGSGTTVMFNKPSGVVVDTSGNVYVSDEYNHRIRKINSTGFVTTFAGNGSKGYIEGLGTNAQFHQPNGIAIDPFGNLVVVDHVNNNFRNISSSGNVSTITGGVGFTYPTDVAVDASGNIYVVDYHRIGIINSTGVVTRLAGTLTKGYIDRPGTNAQFQYPESVAIDSSGDLLIADSRNNCIRKITLSPSLPGPLPVCDSTWHHIALTYSSSSSSKTLTAYIDGKSISSTNITYDISSPSSSSTLRIGSNGNTSINKASGEYFTGSISDIRIFNRALSPNEIFPLKNSPPTPSASPSATSSSSSLASTSASTSPTASQSQTVSSTVSSSPMSSKSMSSSPSSSMSTSPTPTTSSHLSMSCTITGTSSSSSTVTSMTSVTATASSTATRTRTPTPTSSITPSQTQTPPLRSTFLTNISPSPSSLVFEKSAYISFDILLRPKKSTINSTSTSFFKLDELLLTSITTSLRRDLSDILKIDLSRIVVLTVKDLLTNVQKDGNIEEQVLQRLRQLQGGSSSTKSISTPEIGYSLEIGIGLGRKPSTDYIALAINTTAMALNSAMNISQTSSSSGSLSLPFVTSALSTQSISKLPSSSFEFSADLSSLIYLSQPRTFLFPTNSSSSLYDAYGVAGSAGVILFIVIIFFYKRHRDEYYRQEAIKLKNKREAYINNPIHDTIGRGGHKNRGNKRNG
jgi:sugar lactone lactonase YvrE